VCDTPCIQTSELQDDHHGVNSHYVGPKSRQFALSFLLTNDEFTRHFMIHWPQDQDFHRLNWVCRALTPINLETIGVHARQIQVE